MLMQINFHGLSDAMLFHLTSLSANEIGVIENLPQTRQTLKCSLFNPSAPGAVSYSLLRQPRLHAYLRLCVCH